MTQLPPFSEPRIEALHGRLRAFAEEAMGPAEPRRRGTRIEQRWSEGEAHRPPDAPEPGARRIALGVFHRRGAEASFGLQYSAAATDAERRGVQVFFATGGRELAAETVSLTLHPAEGAPVTLGVPLSTTLGEETFRSAERPDLPTILGTLKAYQEGPAALVDEGQNQLAALEEVAHAALEDRDFPVCDYGPSPGNGVPGPCVPREPTDEEVAVLQRRLDADLTHRRKVLEANAAAFAALVEQLLPPL